MTPIDRIIRALALVLVSGALTVGIAPVQTLGDPAPTRHPGPAQGELVAQRLTPQTAAPSQGFRRNDSEIRRQLRVRKGVPLQDRVRLGIQERIREDRQHRFEDNRLRDGAGQIRIDKGFGRRTLDDAANRRLDRATQAEREAQARARENYKALLQKQRAERGLKPDDGAN